MKWGLFVIWDLSMRKSAHQGHKSERLRHNLNLIDRRDVLGLIVNIKETDSVTKEDKREEQAQGREEKKKKTFALCCFLLFILVLMGNGFI